VLGKKAPWSLTYIILALCALSFSERAAAQYRWTDSGRIALDGASDWDGVDDSMILALAFNSSWRQSHSDRYDVISAAVSENWQGLCGAEARAEFHADEGDKWCSEYARTIYQRAGGTGVSDADTVRDLVDVFQERGGYSTWGSVSPYGLQPGDYLAITGSGGEKSHSGIVIAISEDHRYIWTSEGNLRDCVQGQRRDFVDFEINRDLDGFGNADVLFLEIVINGPTW